MIIKRDTKVKTKFGIGKILDVDVDTYSITLFIIEIINGLHKGSKIAITEGEFIIL